MSASSSSITVMPLLTTLSDTFLLTIHKPYTGCNYDVICCHLNEKVYSGHTLYITPNYYPTTCSLLSQVILDQVDSVSLHASQIE